MCSCRERVTGVTRQIYPAARGLLVNVPAKSNRSYQWILTGGPYWYLSALHTRSTYETPGPPAGLLFCRLGRPARSASPLYPKDRALEVCTHAKIPRQTFARNPRYPRTTKMFPRFCIQHQLIVPPPNLVLIPT